MRIAPPPFCPSRNPILFSGGLNAGFRWHENEHVGLFLSDISHVSGMHKRGELLYALLWLSF